MNEKRAILKVFNLLIICNLYNNKLLNKINNFFINLCKKNSMLK